MLRKIEGRGEEGIRGMRRLERITYGMDMNLGKLQEMVRDGEAWHAVVHGAAKSQTQLSNWTETDTGIVHFSKYIVELSYKQKPTEFTGILNPDSINLDQSIFL